MPQQHGSVWTLRPSQPNLTPHKDATTAWISEQACARWSNGLTTGGASIGWHLQAGDESLQSQSDTVDNS